MQETVSAERLVSVVRVHADRVHDAVRRLGCSPPEAAQVVEASALDLVEAVARRDAGDPLGWWSARARELATCRPGEHRDVPVGEGVLATDGDQALLGAALEGLPERQRFALLLRDSYDLPPASVGAALGTTADGAMEEIGLARLAFLPAFSRLEEGAGRPTPSTAGHPADLAALARLGEGGQVEARDATLRRHAQACAGCGEVIEAQDRAHRLLAGLVVVALGEHERERLLARVEEAARRSLPPAAAVVVLGDDVLPEDEDEVPRRLLSPLGVLLGLVLAVAAGVGAGLLSSRSPGGIDPAVAAAGQSLVTAAPVPTLAPPPPEQVQRAASPPPAETRVFTIAPKVSPTPSPTPAPPSPTPSPSTAPVAGLAVAPGAGPNGADVTVTGTGWTAGQQVTIEYLDTLGEPTGSSATAVAGPDGAFTVGLAAQDPANIPGLHEVRAANGTQSASADYDAQA